MNLRDASGANVLASTTTNSNGAYEFDDLDAGIYQSRVRTTDREAVFAGRSGERRHARQRRGSVNGPGGRSGLRRCHRRGRGVLRQRRPSRQQRLLPRAQEHRHRRDRREQRHRRRRRYAHILARQQRLARFADAQLRRQRSPTPRTPTGPAPTRSSTKSTTVTTAPTPRPRAITVANSSPPVGSNDSYSTPADLFVEADERRARQRHQPEQRHAHRDPRRHHHARHADAERRRLVRSTRRMPPSPATIRSPIARATTTAPAT